MKERRINNSLMGNSNMTDTMNFCGDTKSSEKSICKYSVTTFSVFFQDQLVSTQLMVLLFKEKASCLYFSLS